MATGASPRLFATLAPHPGSWTGTRVKLSMRKERDSNPRYGLSPYKRFPGVPVKPLLHLSEYDATRGTASTRRKYI